MLPLKKIISRLFFPVPLCVEILLVGLILLWFTRRQKAGKILVSIATGMLLLMGHKNVSYHLLAPLENRHPAWVAAASESQDEVASGNFIVVLSGGFTNDPDIPLDARLSRDTVARVVEGTRLYRRLPGHRLLLSGGGLADTVPAADHMARLAEGLGVSREDIILESSSQDTEAQARLIKPVVGEEPFLLVTSASHMPRSMALFQKMGMNPVAAPADYLAHQGEKIAVDDLYPSSGGLEIAERAVYEYLGLAWAKLRGKI